MRQTLVPHGLCLRFGATAADRVCVSEIAVTAPALQRRSGCDELLHHRNGLGYLAFVDQRLLAPGVRGKQFRIQFNRAAAIVERGVVLPGADLHHRHRPSHVR